MQSSLREFKEKSERMSRPSDRSVLCDTCLHPLFFFSFNVSLEIIPSILEKIYGVRLLPFPFFCMESTVSDMRGVRCTFSFRMVFSTFATRGRILTSAGAGIHLIYQCHPELVQIGKRVQLYRFKRLQHSYRR